MFQDVRVWPDHSVSQYILKLCKLSKPRNLVRFPVSQHTVLIFYITGTTKKYFKITYRLVVCLLSH